MIVRGPGYRKVEARAYPQTISSPTASLVMLLLEMTLTRSWH